MKPFTRSLLFFLVVVLALSLAGCGPVRCDGSAEDQCIRVLFVGNSYTFVNDLPGMFSELARSGGHQVEVSTIAEGGWGFTDHVESPRLSNTLASSQWDYVVLQERSQNPPVEYARVNFMYPAARSLVRLVRMNNANPIFFETWGHKNGYPENGMDYETMQYETIQGYIRIGRELNVPLAQVGLAWYRAWIQDPNLALWQDDGSHPTEQGTYLAACVFYITFFHESPVGLSYRGNLSKEAAGQLQEGANSLLVNP